MHTKKERLRLKRYGKLLQARRKQLGFSLEDLSKKSGVNKGCLSRIENGGNPTLTTIWRINKCL